ncbi:class I SAM-dependent methyltransferase [Candidatus Bathyarchaeota archaeon]|nr:class I SAM-dependent methyltransferase [Candidatus Bathyarchaeota archaeon]
MRKSYEASSKVYERLYSEEQGTKHSLALRMLDVSTGERILDNGCGSGLFAYKLAPKGAFLVEVDLSISLLRVAKEASRLHGGEVYFICCDSDFLPFIDKAFDKVFAITLLQNLPKPLTTIQEMKRVTKDHGYILLTFLKKAFSLEEAQVLVRKAGLRVLMSKEDDSSKDYFLLCAKV